MLTTSIGNKTFKHLLGLIANSNVSLLELKQRLDEKPYRATDTGVRPKLMADWNAKDLLLVKPKANKMHRFSITEFVWVKLIEKMRLHGFPLKTIKNFKNEIETPWVKEVTDELPPSVLFEQMKDLPGINDHKHFRDFLEKMDLNKILDLYMPQMGLSGNLLEMLVLFCLFLKTPISFFIDHEGKGIIFNPILLKEGLYDQQELDLLFSRSFVSISLSEVLSEVLLLSDVEILHGQLMVLSDMEANVLETLREDDLLSVVVQFDKGNKMDLMEVKKLQKTEREARLMDLMLKDGYQDITVKTQHGKVVYCENTRKVKLK